MMPGKVLFIIFFLGWCQKAMPQSTRRDCIDAIHRGTSYLNRFMAPDAAREYQAAIRMARQLQNDSLYATALFGAGQAIWYGGNFIHAADTVALALQRFRSMEDLPNITAALRILSNIYDDMGDYENAFKAVQDALSLFSHYKDRQNKILSLVQMGKLYKNIGDYVAAMDYYTRALEEKPARGEYEYRELYHCIGELYVARNKPDSANYFYQKAFIGNPNSRIIRLRIGELYLLKNKPDSAFPYFSSLQKEAEATRDINIQIGTMLGLGRIAIEKEDIPSALRLVENASDLAAQRGSIQFRQDAAGLLAFLYERQGNASRALYFQKLHDRIKDSTLSDVFKGQLYSFKQSKQSAELQSLENGKRLAQRTILIVCLLALLALAIILFRHENEKLRLRQQASELQMQALRAQMNPHFIFNCLSAINHFILNREGDKASEYLTRFSRLIRMVLINAGKTSISLEEELNMLTLYLDMEQLRFHDAFEYHIQTDPPLQPSMITVPSFILQPFCENAIWHGLLHKEGKGRLDIHLRPEGSLLICSIRDNGIGIEKATELKMRSKEKGHSLGQKLSAERLALFNRGNGSAVHFTIQDVKDEQGDTTGALVILRIKLKQIHD